MNWRLAIAHRFGFAPTEAIEVSKALPIVLPGAQAIWVGVRSQQYPGISGHGVSDDPQAATLKALMELVERKASAQVTANGFGAHFSLKAAKRKARQEALERDAWIRFICSSELPRRVEQIDNLTILEINCADPRLSVVAAWQDGFDCIPFGLGAALTYREARLSALQELGLSLIRHKSEECSATNPNADSLHQRTRLPEIRKRLLVKQTSQPEVRHVFRETYQIHPGDHRWPISVCSAHSAELIPMHASDSGAEWNGQLARTLVTHEPLKLNLVCIG
jgi:hypothetical protein